MKPYNILLFIKKIFSTLISTAQRLDEININQGIILSNLNKNKNSKELQEYEFKVFSQWGEDGIIQYLINKIPIKSKVFIEFGVENYIESNKHYFD